MKLQVVSPAGVILDREVKSVSLPGTEGRFTVLRGHAPLVSGLTAGEVEYDNQSMKIEGGMAHVKNDMISVFVKI